MEINDGIINVDNNGNKILSISYDENTHSVNSWFLMNSSLPVSLILASYLLFVLKIGPEFMKKRDPYKLQTIIPLYNAVQVLISCFLVYVSTSGMVSHGLMPKTCVMDIDYTRKHVAAAMYYYLLAKISELLDTIFYVLRKKENQVSFLHVYHHTLMVVVTWIALKYEPTYILMFMGILNSFIHVIMYTYYGLSSFPNLKKYLWWKKYITGLQLVQFVLVLIHFGMASAKSECTPSYVMSISMTFNGLLFLYLFGSFYVRTYKKKTSANAISSKETNINNGTNRNLHEMDTKMIQNGTKARNGYRKINNGTDFTGASITLNDTYKIKLNLESKKTKYRKPSLS